MKRALLVLAACGSKHAAPPPPEAALPRDAAVDAVPCPGKPADCAACGSGNGSACDQVAFVDGMPDAMQAYWYDRACTLGDLVGCQGLSGLMVLAGSHEDFVRAQQREQDVARAQLAAQRTRCTAGDEDACAAAAITLEVGHYVPRDLAAALALLDPLCTAGKPRACLVLASLDQPAADKIRYAKRGCTLGDARQCGDLVGLFDDHPFGPGLGGFARTELAHMCTARQADACWVLGGLYVTGKGGAKDRGRGAALVTTACTLDPDYCDTRDRLARGGGFFDAALDNLPKLDLGPLIDATKNGKKPTR